MIIENWNLLRSIEQSIQEYNDKLWREEDKDKEIDYKSIKYLEDGLRADVPEEILSKLEILKINLILRNIEKEEMQSITKQLSQILETMNLKVFHFSILAKGTQYPNLDISFLEHLNKNVERILLSGIDLSHQNPHIFERFRNLRYLGLPKCNITNPNIISRINSEVFVSLENNKIDPKYFEDSFKLIKDFNGRIKFSVKELEIIQQIYFTRKVDLNDYLRLMEFVDFDGIPGLTVEIKNDFDFENINGEQIVNILNRKTNIILTSTSSNLLSLDSLGTLKVPTRVIIKNASELSEEQLLEHPFIESVQIQDGHNTELAQGEPYSREEYQKVRREIDTIISQIKIPDEDDPNKEKKIFSQIYRILGKRIDYDYNAISEAEKNNERLQITCRNLLGGLIENRCVCGGYADILRNVLSCAGIYAEFIRGIIDFENGVTLNLKDPSGHAWNLVRLDGKKYWTDLTWDANNIKVERYPLLYCLKSTRDFKHDSFKKRLEDVIEDPCLESVPEEEQIMLFTGKAIESKGESKDQENKSIAYLSNCIMSIADEGLTSTRVRRTASEVNKATDIKILDEKMEGIDERD